MRYLYIILIFIFASMSCYAKHLNRESVYQEAWCNKHNGIMESELNDKTRVDCLTKRYAVEVDFAPKWAECIGQSLYYGISTKHKPACLLIMEDKEKDVKFYERLKSVSKKHGITIFTITPNDLY